MPSSKLLLSLFLLAACGDVKHPVDGSVPRDAPSVLVGFEDLDEDGLAPRTELPRSEGLVRARAFLEVERVAILPYLGPDRMVITVRLANELPRPVSLRKEDLFLEMPDGARVPARDVDAPRTCPAAEVPSGRAERCSFVFVPPEAGRPLRLVHSSLATAIDIAECAAGSPSGLCSAGELCSDGACAPLCDGPAGPGACFFPEEVCSPGGCVLPCSDEVPNGACQDGYCEHGACTPW